MRLSFLFLLLFFTTSTVIAQQKFHVQYFNTETGLPSNGIKGLQWDKQTGFLWIATEAGIVRYNGLEFKTYNSNDNPHITNERILFLVKNNQNVIYTADNSRNIFKVDKNKLVYLETKFITGNARSSIITITISEKLYKQSGDFEKPGQFSLQFSDILPTSDTSAFILHAGRLFLLAGHLKSPERVSLPFPPRVSFKCSGEVFLGDSVKNLYHFDKNTHKLTPVALDFAHNIDRLDRKKMFIIWTNGMDFPVLFYENTAWRIDYVNERLQATLITEQVPQDILIRYVQYDDEKKILAIGTDSKGVVLIRQNKVESVRYTEAGVNQRTSYYGQVELGDGSILTNEGHVLRKKPGPVTKLPITGRFNLNLYLLNDSLLFYSKVGQGVAFNPLHHYNLKTGETKVYPKIRDSSQSVIAESGGQLYFANEFGISRIVADSTERLYSAKPSERINIYYDMKEIEPGVLGIANCNSLLQYNIQTGQLDTIFNTGQYCVRSIWKYKEYVFFGTYGGGLYISKKGIVKPLPLDKNKHLLFTHCFVKDKSDYVWISTNRGLFKASLAELAEVFEKNRQEVYYYYYGKNDGMEMTELNGGCTPCALQLKNGTISFPSMDGLLWVNPDQSKPVLPVGEIYIDEIIADNKSFNPDSISFEKLAAKTRELVVRFVVSAWSNRENMYISYRLNDETEWRPVDIEKGMEIRFNNLPPGKYNLSIRKQNGFGTNNYTYKNIEFYITIPWYKRWWFNVILLGILALLFMWYYNIRTRQLRLTQERLEQQVAEKTSELQQKTEVLEKSDSIKTRLISIISHDIVTPLKFITVAGKNLIEKKKMMSDELQNETIQEMVNTTQELQLLSTNILNWIKYQNEHRRLAMENFNLYDTVEQVTGILKSLAKSKKLTLENKVDPNLNLYQYFEPLKIFIYNLLANAINFSENSSIIIGADEEDDIVRIWVQDSGVGMTTEQVQRLLADDIIITAANVDNRRGHGLGYLIIKDLVKMMGATLQIESEKGKGTTVSIYIPTNQAGEE